MSIRKDKEKLIEEIQKLRVLVCEIHSGMQILPMTLGKKQVQEKINKIHDIIFNL